MIGKGLVDAVVIGRPRAIVRIWLRESGLVTRTSCIRSSLAMSSGGSKRCCHCKTLQTTDYLLCRSKWRLNNKRDGYLS